MYYKLSKLPYVRSTVLGYLTLLSNLFLCSADMKLISILCLPNRSQPSLATQENVVVMHLNRSLYLILVRFRKHLSVFAAPFSKITGGS